MRAGHGGGRRGDPGKIRDKLIERKQDWARDGRLLTGTTADRTRIGFRQASGW